jgi:hypothetical protein
MQRFWRREQIEDIALLTLLDFRRRTGVRLAPPIDVDLVGELACGLQWDWDVLPEPPSTLVWAALFPHEARVVLNETHARKFAASSGLERFTKSHEIGHWMLHVDKEKGEYSEGVAPEFIVRGALHSTIGRAGQTNWLERHADWFAAALLMPASIFVPIAESSDLYDARVLKKLARTFDVSLAALRARLSQLGLSFHPGAPSADVASPVARALYT